MFERMSEDMDINCGTIAEGKEKVEEVGQKIFELVVNTASGNKSKSEINGYGDEEFNPCLLYTSPSPRDRTRSRMPSSA